MMGAKPKSRASRSLGDVFLVALTAFMHAYCACKPQDRGHEMKQWQRGSQCAFWCKWVKTGRDTAAAPFFVSSQQALPSTLLCENSGSSSLCFLFLRASQMLFQSRSRKYVLLALLAALVRGWQLRKRHRKSLVAPKRTSCSSCGTCHRQVYQLSSLKGGDRRRQPYTLVQPSFCRYNSYLRGGADEHSMCLVSARQWKRWKTERTQLGCVAASFGQTRSREGANS